MLVTEANTYNGPTTINGGVAQFAKPASLPFVSAVTVASGAMLAVNFGGPNHFHSSDIDNLLGFLTSTGHQRIAGRLEFGMDTTNATLAVTYSGNITDSGTSGGGSVGFAKLGMGTLILSGANTYSGGTTINGGVLQFDNSGALPSTGGITINAGGALAVAGAQTTAMGWLGSGKIATSSAGALALVGTMAETISMGAANAGLSLVDGGCDLQRSPTPSGAPITWAAVAACSLSTRLSPVAEASRLPPRGP